MNKNVSSLNLLSAVISDLLIVQSDIIPPVLFSTDLITYSYLHCKLY